MRFLFFRLPGYLLFTALVLAGVQALHSDDMQRTFPAAGSFVEVDGLSFHVLRQGQGSPVLLLHGCPGFADDFRLTGDGGPGVFELLAVDHDVIAIDRVGYGYTDGGDDGVLGLFGQADLLPGLLAALGVDSAVLVGHSYGASLALATAVRHPEVVDGMLLLGGAVYGDGVEPGFLEHLAAAPVLGPLVSRSLAPLLGPLVEEGLAEAFAPDPIPPGYAGRFAIHLARPGPMVQRAHEIMGLAPALDAIAPAYRGIKVPVTIVVGGEDARALANNRRLAENLAQAKYVELPGIGHEIPHLRAREVADEVRGLLGR